MQGEQQQMLRLGLNAAPQLQLYQPPWIVVWHPRVGIL